MKKTSKKESVFKMEKYTLKEKLLISSLISFMASFIVFLFNPIDIFANNALEFSFMLKDFIGPVLLIFFASFVLIFSALMLFNKQLLNILTSAILSIFVSSYIFNVTFGKGSFVSGDIRLEYEEAFTIYFAILFITFYIMFILNLFLKKRWKNITVFLCILLIAMNSSTLISDFATKNITKTSGANVEYALSEKNMNNVSDKENIVYFLFDRFDKMYYDEVVENYPDYFNNTLDGFTYFDNAVSTFSRTYPAVAGMITGVTYDGKTSANEYFKNAYTTSPFLKDLKNNGYNINLYVDRYYEYSDAVYFKDTVSNATKIHGYTPNTKKILKYLLILSHGRIAPYKMPEHIFRLASKGSVLRLSDLQSDDAIYHDDDAELYKKIKTTELSTYDCDKNMTFFYLHGSHSPFNLNENAERVETSTSLQQTLGSFKIIDEYISQLKKLGVYDNTTIIISGDHGFPYTDTDPLFDYMEEGTRTCIFVKPKNSRSDKLSIKHTPASVNDIIPTIIKDANIKTKHNYGKSLFEIGENETRSRIYYHSRISGNSKLILDKYKITGDAADVKNWKLLKSINTKQSWY